jgi:methyl-accepting chemotaxis protein
MFSKLSVKQRLHFGFTLIILLIVASGYVSVSSSFSTAKSFTLYREMARDTNLMGRVQANMLMVRMNAKDFFISGSHKDVIEFNFYYDKVRTFIDEAQREISDPGRAKAIDDIDSELKQYQSYFREVESFMNQRKALVEQGLNMEGKRIEQLLSKIMQEAHQDNIEKDTFSTSAQVSGLALRNLLLARLYVIKFLKTNQLNAAQRVTVEFNNMYSDFYKMQHDIEDPIRLLLLKEAFEKSRVYEATFYKVKNIIFKRNVVIDNLNTLGPKIAKLTEDIKLEIKAVQDRMGPELVIHNKNSMIMTVLMSVLSIVIGLIIAVTLPKMIINSLDQLKKGTLSFLDFLNNKTSDIKPIIIKGDDEFSEIAATINENIKIVQLQIKEQSNDR